MGLKKLGVFFGLLLLSLLSVNSANVYLTTCGNSVWSASDTYYINLSNSVITGGTSCFSGNMVGISVYQLNDKISIDNSITGNYFFFNGATHTSNNFYNLNIEYENSLGNKFYFGSAGTDFASNNFYNTIFTGGDLITYRSKTGGGALNIKDNMFYNSSMINLDRLFEMYTDGLVNPRVIENNDFYNSYIWTYRHPYCKQGGNGNWYHNWINSVGISQTDWDNSCNYDSSPSINGIFKGVTDVDNDGNGIGDTFTNRLTYLNLTIRGKGYNFFQNFEETETLMIPIDSNNPNIYINDEVIGSVGLGGFVTTYANGETNDFLGTLLIDTRGGLLVNGGINCALIDDVSCLIQDTSVAQITSGEYKPLMVIYNNQEINNIKFDKVYNTNDNQLIGTADGLNVLDSLRNNITISNSNFSRTDDLSKTGTTNSNHLIKLHANNINLNNNNFVVNGIDTSTIYELLDIKSTTPTSNNIYLNTFDNQLAGAINPSEIFTINAQTNFYNNKLVGDMVIATSSMSNLNVTPLIAYKHTNGNYYYYRVGNFYTANVGCVDADVDGFCDSSYTSGTITDTHPLSIYPFDFTSHLFTADAIVDPTTFNINLTEPYNNQSFSLTSVSDIISFGFSQDSDFPDLVCDYVIDGVTVGEATIINPTKNVVYEKNFTGWTNKTYAYRVECYPTSAPSEFKQSTEINFDVLVSGTGGNGGNETNETTTNGNNVYGGAGNIIDADIGTTADNIVGFFKDLTNGGLSLIIPVGIFFFVILIIGGTMLLIR